MPDRFNIINPKTNEVLGYTYEAPTKVVHNGQEYMALHNVKITSEEWRGSAGMFRWNRATVLFDPNTYSEV